MIAWIRSLFRPKPKRIDFAFVTYEVAEGLLKEGWSIAPEEDRNHHLGMVFLEKLQHSSARAEGQ